jgi:hypothetical protein
MEMGEVQIFALQPLLVVILQFTLADNLSQKQIAQESVQE